MLRMVEDQPILSDDAQRNPRICIIGLGYVGLPLAVAFSRHYDVVGFDTEGRRISELRTAVDKNDDISAEEIKMSNILWTSDEHVLKTCDNFIVAVPRPVTKNNTPDLSSLRSASVTLGKSLKHGNLVVYESTVFPGYTEEICKPILEANSSLKAGKVFF